MLKVIRALGDSSQQIQADLQVMKTLTARPLASQLRCQCSNQSEPEKNRHVHSKPMHGQDSAVERCPMQQATEVFKELRARLMLRGRASALDS